MLFLAFKKIFKNKWLMLSLLLGMILTVSMVCSIPLYTNGILQRMFKKDLENYQISSGMYPGRYEVTYDMYKSELKVEGKQYKNYNFFKNKIQDEFVNEIGIDRVADRRELQMTHFKVTPSELYGKTDDETIAAKMIGLENLNDHVKLVAGRLANAEIVDGVLECVIFQQYQKEKNIILDKVYILENFISKENEIIKIMPVGIIAPKFDNDPWWINITDSTYAFLIDYDYMSQHFLYEDEVITKAKWLYQFDYTKISIEELDHFLSAIDNQHEWYGQYGGINMNFKALRIYEQYYSRARQLQVTLWVLQAPILIMLAFYLFMVAQLVVENDKNEISILKSRGSSRGQIFIVYLLQSVILAIAAGIIGPFLGVIICKMLGAANGFMEFVARSGLSVKMTPDAILYSVIAGVFSVIVMMIPVLKASKVNIVELKQKKSRKWNAPWWQKAFLDVILIGLSIYGLNDYLRQGKTRMVIEQSGLQAPLDPFMFIILTLFILGAGLMFLRIYPLLLRLTYRVGKKKWSPVAYSSFIQVSRSSGREQFLMLFLILTISIGIFSANSARTINQNIEDRVYYDIGCDMKLKALWKSNETNESESIPGEETSKVEEPIIYLEPPFSLMTSIEDTEYAAKVLRVETVKVRIGLESISGELMSINPYDFGNVVWGSGKILPHHINEYLNLMSYSQNSVIVSEAYRQEHELVVGDVVSYSWEGQSYVEGVIVAFVDYWPGINPNISDASKYFIVSNLSYVQVMTATTPYEVWYKTKEGASTQKIYDSIKENNINIEWIEVAKQEMIGQKNDPMLQGINGAMTLSFIVTMSISLLGFIIYWVLSIKSRVLQFGIFRAMGMTKKNVLSMIAIEQILISVVAIIMGLVIGAISCWLFMPLLELVSEAAVQVPPFRLISARKDYIKLYTIVSVMLASGFAFIGTIVSRIKISQVIKLGED